MYKEDLTLNNLQWLICHKTKPNSNQSVWLLITFLVILTMIPQSPPYVVIKDCCSDPSRWHRYYTLILAKVMNKEGKE